MIAESMPSENYKRIASNVDVLISKHGSEKTADLIESIALSKSPDFNSIDLQKFIVCEVVKSFNISVKLLETSNNELYKQARKSCFYLLNYYCKLSLSKIKQKFPNYKKSRQNIGIYIARMAEIVETPIVDKKHYSIHIKIDERIKKFIGGNNG